VQVRAFWLVLVIGSNASYAGMFDDEEARRQIAAQQSVITEMRSQAQTLEARTVKLEEVLANQPMLELQSQIEALRQELNRLHGQIEVLANENESSQKRQKDFYIDLDTRLRRIERPEESGTSGSGFAAPSPHHASEAPNTPESDTAPDADGQSTATSAPSAAPPISIPSASDGGDTRAYDAAYDLFKAGKYKEAISHFNQFIKNHSGSSLAPSAQYWIGNSYYALRDFKNAISNQEKLIKTYPDSSKAPDAMLNIASSQQEMNNRAAAKKTLDGLIARYPGSDAAAKARQRLANKK
jgi:tol-pal system protein YbgF